MLFFVTVKLKLQLQKTAFFGKKGQKHLKKTVKKGGTFTGHNGVFSRSFEGLLGFFTFFPVFYRLKPSLIIEVVATFFEEKKAWKIPQSYFSSMKKPSDVF